MKKLLVYLKDYKKESILGPLFKLLEASFELLVPLVVTKIIDVGIYSHDRRYVLTRFALMIGMAVLGLFCTFVAQYFAARAAVGTASGLRHELIDRIQHFSFTELDRFGASTLITPSVSASFATIG